MFSFRAVSVAALAAAVTLGATGHAGAQTPVHGGTLNFVLKYQPSTLSSINNTSTPTTSAKIFDGLLRYDFDLTPEPQLAREWEISVDGLEYTFRLREGVTFHDGAPFTSADVAFSILRLKEGHPRGRATFANVTEVRTPDPLTAVIVLSQPSPFLITALGGSESPMVPRHLYEGVDVSVSPDESLLIGTGPFILKEWERGSYALLERNPNYWDAPKPYLDSVVIRFITDASARGLAFEAGELDLGGSAPAPLSDLQRFRDDPRYTVDSRSFAYTGAHHQLFFNLDSEPVQDRRVREAVAHAINLDAIVDIVYYGQALPAPSAISVALPTYNDPSITAREFDPARSRALLEEAGLQLRSDGKRLTLRLLINPFIDRRLAEYVRQALAAAEIDAVIEPLEFGAYVRAVYTDREFDMTIESLSNVFDPTVGVQRGYWSKNFRPGLPFSNSANYSNPEVDRTLEAAAVEIDPEARKALFFEFQRIVHEDIPMIGLISPLEVIIANSRLRDYAQGGEGLGGSFADAWFVSE